MIYIVLYWIKIQTRLKYQCDLQLESIFSRGKTPKVNTCVRSNIMIIVD